MTINDYAGENFLCEPPQLTEGATTKLVTLRDLVHISAFVAHSKGWWDPAPGRLTTSLLFRSELSEAFEEFRKGRLTTYCADTEHGMKPEGFFVEVTDLAIRAADTMGRTLAMASSSFAQGYVERFGRTRLDDDRHIATDDLLLEAIGAAGCEGFEVGPSDEQDSSLATALAYLNGHVDCWWKRSGNRKEGLNQLGYLIGACRSVCAAQGHSLAELALLKSKYNHKRSFRHGNKSC
jgi:hypothetical protein